MDCTQREGPAEVTVRVLLVEDMKQVQALVAELLASVGDFRVVHVTATEAEAKLWVAENPGAWDLAIVDLVLDQGTGMAVIPRARDAAEREGGRVIVFSDYASEGIRRHCEKLGAHAVFLKSQVRDFMDYCAQLGGVAALTPA
jgi:DNA-binding NarL/FixJ family response regulator